MIKNASNLYPFALQDQLSNGLTGQAPSVFLRQDNGSFAAASGSVTEVDSTNYPGLYQITLTATECNCNVMTIAVSLPDGQEPAILDVVYPVATGGATPAEIWQYAGGRTVDNTIPSVNDIWGRQAGDTTSRTITNTIPTASDNATAVWGAQTKEVTIATAQADTFATAAALTTVGDNVSAVKAKTDNLPATPAAVGSEMTLTSAYDAAKTASQFDPVADEVKLTDASVVDIQTGLSTFDATADAVIINTTQYNSLASAAAQEAQTAALDKLAASILHWAATASTLTLYDSNGAAIGVYDLTRDSSGNITAIEPYAEDNG